MSVRVTSLTTCLQLKKTSVMYESAHEITFQLLEMSSITTTNQKILNIRARYIFQRFFRNNLEILPICIMKKNQSGSFV